MMRLMSARSGLVWSFAAVLLLEGAIAVLPHVHHDDLVIASCATGGHHHSHGHSHGHDHDHGTVWAAELAVAHHHDCLACTSQIPASSIPHEVRLFETPRPVSIPVTVPSARFGGSRLTDTPSRGPPAVV
jgi:hypothetical protein